MLSCYLFHLLILNLHHPGDPEGGQADGSIGHGRTSFSAPQMCFLSQGHRKNVSLSSSGEDHPIPGWFSLVISDFIFINFLSHLFNFGSTLRQHRAPRKATRR